MITKIKGLELPQLHTLILYGNKIQYLDNLKGLMNLHVLEVNKNQIKNIHYLSTISLPHLELLDISNNCITDLNSTELVILFFKSLKELNAYNNPIEEDFSYKFKLSKNPTIVNLDGTNITPAIRENLELLYKENTIETLIENTNKEYEKRIELEKKRKDRILRSIVKYEQEVKNKYEAYRNDMNKELAEFIEHVSYVRRKKEAGEEIEINEDFLKRWQEKLKEYEKQRVQEEEKTKRDIDVKYNSMVLKKLVGATYSDKLYQISIAKPEIWRELKRKEYDNKLTEEKEVVNDQIEDKHKTLSQELENEKYLNDIIDKGHVKLLKTIQCDPKVVFCFYI